MVVLLCAVAGLAIRFLPSVSVRQTTRAISQSGSRLAPASPAFYLDWWLAIALLIYAIWQVRAKQQRRAIHRQIGWFAPAVAFVDAAWPLVLAAKFSIVVRLAIVSGLLVALTVVLAIIVHRINRSRDLRHSDLYLLDATFGLHLGWTTVLAASTLAALALDAGLHLPWVWLADAVACLVLLAVAGLVTYWCFWLGDRVAIALSSAWGLGWIAIARITGEPHALPVASLALVCAAHVLGFTRWRRRHRETVLPQPVGG